MPPPSPHRHHPHLHTPPTSLTTIHHCHKYYCHRHQNKIFTTHNHLHHHCWWFVSKNFFFLFYCQMYSGQFSLSWWNYLLLNKNVHNLSEGVDAQLLPKILTPQGLAMAAAAGAVGGTTEAAKLSMFLLRIRSTLLLRSRSALLLLSRSALLLCSRSGYQHLAKSCMCLCCRYLENRTKY